MRILVTVKEVAEIADEVAIEGTDVAADALQYDLNEWDDYAIETAVRIAEAGDDVEVVAATIGPERSEETIRMALAKGVDRAIRIWDDSLSGDATLDARVRVALLAAVVEAESPDLVLSGVQSADEANGATGVALAEAVDYAWAAVVNDLERTESDQLAVHRELEGGLEQLATVSLPAVCTVQTGINEPRYASLRGIRQAQSKPLSVETPADLGVSLGDEPGALETTRLAEPTVETEAERWEGDPAETAGKLADLLRDAGVVEG